MNLEEIRGLATEDLLKAEDDGREQLFKLRYASAAESLDNTKGIRETRRRVARIKTVLREREIAAAKAEQEK